jgi:CrcB protein
LGSFLIGVFVGLFVAKWDLSQATRIFLTVGIERGQTLASSAYMVASVALSVGALIAALRFVRALS